MIKEIALADLDTMRAAIAAGVDRVELNSRLDLGGITPDDNTVATAVKLAHDANVDLVVMVRPRG
ncbi:MAG: copper homeostasis protein CutC, partial [Weissella confusa]